MKIGWIINVDERTKDVTDLGKCQAGYLIQLALAWFNLTGLELQNGVIVFTTQKPYDMDIARLAAGCSTGFASGSMLRMKWLHPRWGHCGDIDEQTGTSKSQNLAKEIKSIGRDCLVFGFFQLDHNVAPFLQSWDIPIPLEWPRYNQAALVRIDTDAKSVTFDYPPFPSKGNDL